MFLYLFFFIPSLFPLIFISIFFFSFHLNSHLPSLYSDGTFSFLPRPNFLFIFKVDKFPVPLFFVHSFFYSSISLFSLFSSFHLSFLIFEHVFSLVRTKFSPHIKFRQCFSTYFYPIAFLFKLYPSIFSYFPDFHLYNLLTRFPTCQDQIISSFLIPTMFLQFFCVPSLFFFLFPYLSVFSYFPRFIFRPT